MQSLEIINLKNGSTKICPLGLPYPLQDFEMFELEDQLTFCGGLGQNGTV